MKDVNQIVAAYKKAGAKVIDNVVIAVSSVNPQPKCVKLNIHTNKDVPEYITRKDVRKLGTSRFIGDVVTFGIEAQIRASYDVVTATKVVKVLRTLKDAYVDLLAGATVDILCIPVAKGDPFPRPFAEDDEQDETPEVAKQDSVAHYITKITFGEESAASIADYAMAERQQRITAFTNKINESIKQTDALENAFRNRLIASLQGASNDVDSASE